MDGIPRTRNAIESLTLDDFRKFARLIQRLTGIHLGEDKVALLQNRIRERVIELGLSSFGKYFDYVQNQSNRQELQVLVDRVTTNLTRFFREPAHFAHTRSQLVPEFERDFRAGRARKLRIWSAACSTGEEPYSLSMVLRRLVGRRVEIVASDISTDVLRSAQLGNYGMEKLDDIPRQYRDEIEMGVGDCEFRIAQSARSVIQFRQHNLVERSTVQEIFDGVYCRNVFFYFDEATQQRVLANLLEKLRPGGYLYVGYSEGTVGLNCDELDFVAPAIYRKRA
ncbi:MAG: protein-glutamate O-methyltransferase CheR [Planctomycetota bacterium]